MTRMLAACLVCFVVVAPNAAPTLPPPGHPPIAHAGDAITTEGGATLTLDGSTSWDADGDPLTFAWTQTDGPIVALNLADPVHPTYTAPTPGQAGVPAENQVLVFRLVVNDGSTDSAPSEVRIMVLKPFDPVADGPAVVTNSLTAGNPPGSVNYAVTYAIAHPGTRVTFNIPASDPSYNPTGGYWQLPGGVPVMRYLPALGIGLLARGMTIDGFSQKTNAAAAGAFVNPTGPAIFIPGAILEIGGWSDPAPYPSRIVVRGLAEEMHIEKGDDIVLSGNYHNVYPDGLSSIRGAFDHVGYSSGTTCVRLAVLGGSHIRIGGPTPEERNIIGRGCNGMEVYPAYGLSDLQIVGNYFGVDRLGANGIIGPGGRTGLAVMANGQALDLRIGGVTPGSRNVFAGYDSTALYLGLLNPGLHAVVQGNYFGTNAAGDAAIPSGYNAFVESTAPGELLIGGPEPGAGNLFSGSQLGIYFSGGFYAPWNATFQGNRVGTRADGMSALPNRIGIATGLARGILIGGSGPGEGNLVSGNTEDGISIGGSWSFDDSAILFGNRVGVAADGVTPLGNGGSGIVSATEGFCCPIVAPTIGGVNPGEGNLIAYNGRHGVLIGGVNKFGVVRGNSIFSNGLLGISLGNDSTPRPNDPGDGDDAANYGINYPELLTASSDGSSVTITGQLDTIAGREVFLDFYANDVGDPSGNGEGQRYIGSYSFTTPSVYAGAVPFTATIPGAVTASQVVSATTTDLYGTSEFGRYISVAVVDRTPPSFSCPAPTSASANASGVAPVPDVLAGLTATDNVTPPGSLTMDQSPAAGTLVGVGPHPITVTVTDAAGNSHSCQSAFTVNPAPPPSGGDALVCSAARPTVSEIWPPNHKKVVTVGVLGVTGAASSAIAIQITRILQDEPTNITGDGHTPTDGGGIGTAQVWVRAERAGTPKVPGNGRVYELQFTASSPGVTSCTGVVFVGVPHDQGKGPAIDDVIRYDSTVAGGGRPR